MSINKILIVDDEENICSLLETYLSGQGYQTLLAKNGEEVLKLLEHEKPDIVFLDIRLPGMDGVQILKAIKKINPKISVIMVSGFATEDLAKETLNIGAFDYITKPIDLEKVSEVICCVDLLNFS